MSPEVWVDCPAPLLQILLIREQWQLEILANIPALSDEIDVPAVPPGAHAPLDQLAEQCHAMWGAYQSWRLDNLGGALRDPPPSWPSAHGDAEIDLSETRRAVAAARRHTLLAITRSGPVTTQALEARLGESLAGVTIDVLPVAQPLRQVVSPAYRLMDAAAITTRPGRRHGPGAS